VTFEPGDPDQQAGFALAVTNSQQPLSVQIHLLDNMGFVLCSKDILLKYSVLNAAALAAFSPDKADGSKTLTDQLTQGAEGLQDRQEAAREQGKDLFQNQVGQDGQVASINAHGDIPCSAKAYEKAETWSFTTNFPSLAEQNGLLRRQKEIQAKAGRPSAEEAAAHKKTATKTAANLLPFSIEGDDAIVDFDAYHGTIVTRGRKTFFIDKSTAALANSRWQDYPVVIHFRCDRSSECTLMNGGAGAMHARLAR
jgi:hypothetical protein